MAERSFETCNIDASFGRKTQAKSDLAATGESLQLRRAEINSSYNSYAHVWSQFMFDGGIQSRLVPAVGKSEDLLVERHDVQNRLLLPPPANRSSFTSVLSETTFTESFRKICVRGVRADLGDGIHIVGGADVCCRFVGDEQGTRASSDKNQFPKEWFQKARRLK